jgi:hypothetical protein
LVSVAGTPRIASDAFPTARLARGACAPDGGEPPSRRPVVMSYSRRLETSDRRAGKTEHLRWRWRRATHQSPGNTCRTDANRRTGGANHGREEGTRSPDRWQPAPALVASAAHHPSRPLALRVKGQGQTIKRPSPNIAGPRNKTSVHPGRVTHKIAGIAANLKARTSNSPEICDPEYPPAEKPCAPKPRQKLPTDLAGTKSK